MPYSLRGQPESHPKRILIVDDEEDCAALLRLHLAKLPNCQASVAASGEQALQLLEQQSFDLLITDYKMPGMDGLVLAARVRQICPHMGIMMITAHHDKELYRQAARVSIQRVLPKLAEPAEIRAAVLEGLGQSGGHNQIQGADEHG
jgi:CheY-like chemotaxis protein